MRRNERRPLRPSRRPILIVCEGAKTEPLYFAGLCGEEVVQAHIAAKVERGKGSTALSVVEQAVALRNAARFDGLRYDVVWCVLDVEDASRRENLRQAVALAKKEDISLALSNPSFEVWLITHFESTSKSFLNSKAAETHLNAKHWKTHFGQEYDKADAQLYSRLADRVDAAVSNARWTLETHHANGLCADCNSSTDVYRFVEYLRPVGGGDG